MIEYIIEIGYGIVYLILAILTILKYIKTKSRLALYFIMAFIALGISGLYGGIAEILDVKILEVYYGLALLALAFFLIGLIKI